MSWYFSISKFFFLLTTFPNTDGIRVQVLALEYRSEDNTTVNTAETLELSEIEEPESEEKGDIKAWTGSPSERRTVLDSLVGTILSQNTTDNNSKRAFASLKRVFPTWEEVRSTLDMFLDASVCFVFSRCLIFSCQICFEQKSEH